MAQLNYKVKIIRTSIDNIKLTYIDDLNVIQKIDEQETRMIWNRYA